MYGYKIGNFGKSINDTRIASNPCGVCDKPITKSIVMCSHFHSGIGNNTSSPAGFQPSLVDTLDISVQIL